MAGITFTDQMGKRVVVPFPPKRIVSLVPSQTELLFDLGLEEAVVGITKFCIHPQDKFKSTAKVGGTKKLHLDKIRELMPDLIIGNKEENDQAQIEELMTEFPVWMSDIHTLDDAYGMMEGIGAVTGTTKEAQELIDSIKMAFADFQTSLKPGSQLRVAYFIWKDPYMVAGPNTFINEILQLGGWINAVSDSRYPELSESAIKKLNPDLIFLSSEPYPFKDKHVAEFKEFCPDSKVLIVDGELFSWYGSRLRHTPQYLFSLQQAVNQ
ncbi:MAG TPA: helical backbone metal receptor [Sphingobacteriaceae bacterium]